MCDCESAECVWVCVTVSLLNVCGYVCGYMCVLKVIICVCDCESAECVWVYVLSAHMCV